MDDILFCGFVKQFYELWERCFCLIHLFCRDEFYERFGRVFNALFYLAIARRSFLRLSLCFFGSMSMGHSFREVDSRGRGTIP